MSNHRLAIDAWESLFRAQYEVFGELKCDFDDTISQAEYDVLLTVTRGAGNAARLRDVTSRMLISQPSVSRLVDRMVARGLVTKAIDPLDARGAIVTATADGVDQFQTVARRHGRSITERMSVLDADELATLLALTSKLRASVAKAS